MDYNKPTDELDRELSNVKPKNIDDYFKDNSRFLADEKKAFYYYMKDTIEDKNILLKDVYLRADISESWGGKIITMERHTKNRDTILRLCFAAHFTLLEVNRALKLYGMNPLYSKDRRDACLIVAISNRIYDLYDLNDFLIQNNHEPLTAENQTE